MVPSQIKQLPVHPRDHVLLWNKVLSAVFSFFQSINISRIASRKPQLFIYSIDIKYLPNLSILIDVGQKNSHQQLMGQNGPCDHRSWNDTFRYMIIGITSRSYKYYKSKLKCFMRTFSAWRVQGSRPKFKFMTKRMG